MATVNKTHKDYDEMLSRWQACEDASDGQYEIHKAGEKYLPRLKDQSNDDYNAYKSRALFYNATWRTIAGLQGMLFRKPPTVDVSASLEPLLEDVTMSGESLNDFVFSITEDALELGRVGILVDYPQNDYTGLTQADVAALNLRPCLKDYDAFEIINWREERINNRTVLSLVVLTEDFEIRKNEFEYDCETRYRVLDLFEGKYRQRVFRVNDRDEDELISESFPLMNNNTMDHIPFIFIGVDSLRPDIETPPLIDLVDANLSHYRVNADYEHGCHFTGLPTPVVSGYSKQDDSEKLYIGSTSAWVFPDPDASASYLEFSGQGLSALENNLRQKEQMMAILGARMLSADKKGVEAADTAAIYRSGENSVLSAMAQNISNGITWCLNVMDMWAGGDGVVSFELNRDFIGHQLSGQDLLALVQSWQSGAISSNTLFYKLEQGEMYPDNTDFQTEMELIQNNSQNNLQM